MRQIFAMTATIGPANCGGPSHRQEGGRIAELTPFSFRGQRGLGLPRSWCRPAPARRIRVEQDKVPMNLAEVIRQAGPSDGELKYFSFALRDCLPYMFNRMVKYPSRTLSRTFAALADPTRRRILAHLARGDKCVTRLAKPHAMSLPAVSKHLRVLEKAGLLRRRRYGRVHEMQLEAKPLKEAAQWVEEYRKFWEASLDRLAEYLEKTNKTADKKRRT